MIGILSNIIASKSREQVPFKQELFLLTTPYPFLTSKSSCRWKESDEISTNVWWAHLYQSWVWYFNIFTKRSGTSLVLRFKTIFFVMPVTKFWFSNKSLNYIKLYRSICSTQNSTAEGNIFRVRINGILERKELPVWQYPENSLREWCQRNFVIFLRACSTVVLAIPFPQFNTFQFLCLKLHTIASNF